MYRRARRCRDCLRKRHADNGTNLFGPDDAVPGVVGSRVNFLGDSVALARPDFAGPYR